jgi:hypothetical protein
MGIDCQNVTVVAIGSISISSTPTGGTVWLASNVSGSPGTYVNQGVVTSISNVAIGDYFIKLVLAGYADYVTSSFTVSANINTPITATFAGSLYITSILTGASVYIDSNPTSLGVTPLTVVGFSPGTHHYILTYAGYADTASTGFSITAGTTTTVSNVSFLGSASFTSSPTGARIWIDGVDKGVDTNGTVTGLTSGTRGYTLVKTDYANATGTLTAANDTTATVSLITMSPVGSISVSSTPSGAAILIDNVSTGFTTPSTISGVLTGLHDVKLTLATYQDYIATGVNVTQGGTANVSHTMVLSTGSVSFTSTPAGARIWLGPHLGTLLDKGVNTPNTISTLTPGTYDYNLVLSGYADLTGTTTINAGSQTDETLTFAGSLNISTTPSGAVGASVYIDGSQGSSGVTPLIITGFTPETHTYRLTKTGYTEITATNFTIIPGQTTTVSQAMLTVANIVAQSITLTPSNPCIEGSCSVGVSVTWINNGQSSGTIVPNISVDDTPISPVYESQSLGAGLTVTKTFLVTGLTAARSPHSICPIPNV